MWKIVVIALIVAAAVLWYRHTQLPDVQLGTRLGKLCDVAEVGADKPQEGVQALFDYFRENTPALMNDFGRTLVVIEAEPDASHDARARDAARRMWGPLVGCSRSLERFGNAVERDEVASSALEAASERVSRTLSILFGQETALAPPPGVARLLRLHAK